MTVSLGSLLYMDLYLSVPLHHCLSISVPLHHCLSISVPLHHCLSILSLSITASLPLCPSPSLPLYLSVPLHHCLSISPLPLRKVAGLSVDGQPDHDLRSTHKLQTQPQEELQRAHGMYMYVCISAEIHIYMYVLPSLSPLQVAGYACGVDFSPDGRSAKNYN